MSRVVRGDCERSRFSRSSSIPRTATGRGGKKAARVNGVDGHVGFVAGIDRGGQFGLIFIAQRETTGEKNQHLAAGNGAKIFCQTANREQHGARAKVRGCIRKRGRTDRGGGRRSHRDVRRRRVGLHRGGFYSGDSGAQQKRAGREEIGRAHV